MTKPDLRERAEALVNEIGKPSNLCTPACEKCAANDAEQLAAILAFAQAVQEDTREECAKVAESHGVYPELNVWAGGPEWYKHGQAIASAIRAQQGGKDE